jgi:hypothetical protein
MNQTAIITRLALVDDALERLSGLVVPPLRDETAGQLDAAAREV